MEWCEHPSTLEMQCFRATLKLRSSSEEQDGSKSCVGLFDIAAEQSERGSSHVENTVNRMALADELEDSPKSLHRMGITCICAAVYGSVAGF